MKPKHPKLKPYLVGLETEMDMKVRCRKPKHRNIYLGSLGVKHNIRTYLRATALKVVSYFAPTS